MPRVICLVSPGAVGQGHILTDPPPKRVRNKKRVRREDKRGEEKRAEEKRREENRQ
jgi:hypothetical protein